jgi:RecA/RadA recombinase
VGTFGNEKKPRLSTAEELCAEIEENMSHLSKKYKKQIVLIDSVAAMMPDVVAAAGMEGRNMRTNMGLPMFMSGLMQRWIGLAQAYSALIIFVNQLRTKPAAFGDPAYTPGGNALPFYSHIRVRVCRVKNGRIMREGRVCGIKGIMTNVKNKAGGRERASVGYKIMFDGPIEFMDARDAKKDEDDDE